jgi:tetratricopeptide (TPR) repeat protein
LGEEGHPSDGELQQFARGELAGAAARRVVGHLLHRCAPCAATLQQAGLPTAAGPAAGAPLAAEDYDAAIERAVEGFQLHGSRVLVKKREARRIQHALAAGEWQPGRPHALRGRPSYPFYEALLQRAWEVRFSDLREMVSLTWYACLVAVRLGRDGYTASQVADFQARAYGEHCNAQRAAHRLREAEEAFVRAVECWKEGSKDFRLWVRLMDIRASLLGEQHRTDDAIDILDDVFQAYSQLGDRHSAGRAQVKRAVYIGYGGDPETAVELLDEALKLLDAHREPDLVSMATHNRLWFLVDSGRCRQARADLWRQRRWMLQYQDLGEISRVRVAYLEARINAGLGELDRAERGLRTALDGLAAEELRVLRGVVSLELAVVWMRQGRLADASTLATETAASLLAIGVPREAQKALHVLLTALEAQAATAALVQDVVDFLRRVEHAPQARFETTGS